MIYLCFSAVAALQPATTVPDDVDTIVVTADRTPQSLQVLPGSASVLDADDIELIAPRHPADVLNRVPGVFVQAGSGQEHLSAIRSPVLTGGAGAGSFLYLQDGVPLRAPGFANVNGLFDAQLPFAERIEIIRGPGDVAYGSNALHGVVNVVSPRLGETRRDWAFSIGAFDRQSLTLAQGTEASSLGIHLFRDGGYRDDSGVFQGKVSLARTLGGATFRLHGHHLEQETAGFIVGEDAFADDDLRRGNPNPEAFRDVRQWLASASVPVARGAWSGTITPYARWNDMAFRLHFLPGDALEENEHASVGVQSVFENKFSDNASVLIGLDADYSNGSLREFQDEPTVFSFTQGLHYDYAVQATEIAPFVRLTFRPLSNWTVRTGVRYTSTRYSYETDAAPNVATDPGRFLRLPNRSDSFDVVTGKASATYRVSDHTHVFGSIARGARPPQTTDLYRTQDNQSLDGISPETLVSGELGLRQSGPWGQFSIAAFSGRKDNFFFRDADGRNVTDGKTTHQGVEVEGTIHLSSSFKLRAAGTFAEHEYDFDRVVGNTSEVITRGNTVDTAPRTLANTQLEWTPTSSFAVELGLTHVGEYFTNAANTEEYDGHDVVDVRLRYRPTDDVTAVVAVRNVTDERFARRADFAFGNERYFPGEERAVELSLSGTF